MSLTEGVARSLERAPAREFLGRVWRTHWKQVAAIDWSLSLRTSGRYHRGLDLFSPDQVWAALYTSLAPEVAIWELVRRSAARNLAYLQNNVLTELDVRLTRVIDLSEPRAIGLSRADLIASDSRLCQEAAALVVSRGDEGVLVPSAALPSANLVIFPQNLDSASALRVARSVELPLERISRERDQTISGTG